MWWPNKYVCRVGDKFEAELVTLPHFEKWVNFEEKTMLGVMQNVSVGEGQHILHSMVLGGVKG